jgi:hypothetical protein
MLQFDTLSVKLVRALQYRATKTDIKPMTTDQAPRKPYVFVVCEPTDKDTGSPQYDLTPATEFGQPVILLHHSKALLSNVVPVRKIKERLAEYKFDPAIDYLLPIGSPCLMSLCAAVVSTVAHGKFKMLQWERGIRKYVMLEVDTSGRAQ